MSTKCTVTHGEKFHLYEECFEDDGIYLEMETDMPGCAFSASPGYITVKIPIGLWEIIRKYTHESAKVLDMSDEQIQAKVEKNVDERIEEYKKNPKGLSSFIGVIPYGLAEEPKEKQIQSGLKYWRTLQQTVKNTVPKQTNNS
jgi:hypothetical protein